MAGWRIAKLKYAQSIDDMMSGEAAYLFGGRWNSRGTRMVYLGSSIAHAAFEILVHTNRSSLIRSYSKLKVSFTAEQLMILDEHSLPRNWADPSMYSAVAKFGDAWAESGSSLVLQVPSASLAGETNYLVNPQHPDFGQLQFGELESFSFDQRLLT
jgi:RES domain-containing protein